MKKDWTTTKLTATASLSALTAIFMLAGAGLAAASGSFATSGVVGLIVQSFMYALAVLTIRQFGTGAVMGLIFGLLIVPLPTMGTPGFFPKVLLAGIMGLAADLTFLLFQKRERLAAMVCGGITQAIVGLALFGAAKTLGFPGIENLPKFLSSSIGLVIGDMAAFLVGMLGGYFAWHTYNKIKNTSVVKRIQKN